MTELRPGQKTYYLVDQTGGLRGEGRRGGERAVVFCVSLHVATHVCMCVHASSSTSTTIHCLVAIWLVIWPLPCWEELFTLCTEGKRETTRRVP